MKAVVFDPINCMVGCTTCANTCPAKAMEELLYKDLVTVKLPRP